MGTVSRFVWFWFVHRLQFAGNRHFFFCVLWNFLSTGFNTSRISRAWPWPAPPKKTNSQSSPLDHIASPADTLQLQESFEMVRRRLFPDGMDNYLVQTLGNALDLERSKVCDLYYLLV